MPNAPFNPLVHTLSAPPIPLVQKWVENYDGAYGPALDLSQAVPGYPPHKSMLQWLGEAASDPSFAGYGDIAGEPELRSAYASHVTELYKSPLTSGNIHITSGCNQAFISSIMAIAGVGDTVLMSNPFYFNHESTLSMLGIKTGTFVTNSDTDFVPDLQSIKNSIDETVKAIVLVTPNNPTGAIYPADWLETVFDLCATKGIWLILDETYRDFLPEENQTPHSLFSKENWQGNLIQLYSFSKSFCIPGHRLGAVLGSEDLILEISKVMDNLQICAPRPPQVAVAKALPLLKDWREMNRIEIAARVNTLKQAFLGLPDWNISAIGAYFAYIKHPFTGASSLEVAQQLATERGVICIPGEFFGRNQENYLRFAFANADQETLNVLPARLKGFRIK
ncbi:MAG: aminotransferase [Sneathiella sp.]